MLSFHPIDLACRPKLVEKLYAAPDRGCEYTFGNLYIWKDVYKTKAALQDGFLFVRFDEVTQSYLFPVGEGDLAAAMEAILADCDARGVPFHMVAASAADKAALETLFPDRFAFHPSRDFAEYVYNSADLIELRGKKYHGKRNHLSRFMKTYPDHLFEPITPDNIGEVTAFNDRWYEAFADGSESLSEERLASERALRHLFDLNLTGGLLRVDGRVQAFAVGEPINKDTFCVHIEKANYDIAGAYPAINQMFARRFCKDYLYINREDDVGDEGLRKAKLSYYPAEITEKYVVVLK